MTKVLVSAVIDAPVDAVWALLGDFHGMARWHPGIERSESEDGGQIRRLTLRDGAVIVEKRLEESRTERFARYALLSGRMPVSDYIGTMSAREVTMGGGTYVEWSSTFETEADLQAITAGLRGVYEAGLRGLAEAVTRAG